MPDDADRTGPYPEIRASNRIEESARALVVLDAKEHTQSKKTISKRTISKKRQISGHRETEKPGRRCTQLTCRVHSFKIPHAERLPYQAFDDITHHV